MPIVRTHLLVEEFHLLHNIYYGIYHYFFQLPLLKPQFPFIYFASNAAEGRYVYFSYDYSGVFVIPFNWIWISLPFLYKKKYQCRFTTNEKTILAKSVVATTTIATIILAIFNYCMAGINLRYIIDINIGVLMVSILLFFAMQPKLKPGSICYKLACILCVASIFVGVLFTFQNWDCNWKNISSKSYLKAYDFFMGISE